MILTRAAIMVMSSDLSGKFLILLAKTRRMTAIPAKMPTRTFTDTIVGC